MTERIESFLCLMLAAMPLCILACAAKADVHAEMTAALARIETLESNVAGIQTGDVAIGEERGERRGLISGIHQILMERFGSVPGQFSTTLQEEENIERLRTLHLHALRARSLEEFEEGF